MSIKKAKNARIKYGAVEVSSDDLSPAAVRQRISILIPEDILSRLRKMAKKEGIGYQTLINRLLRDGSAEKNSVVARLDRIERAISAKAR